jgi:type IV secretion system protein VirB4
VALSFVGATDKESIATIKALEAAYGPAWVNDGCHPWRQSTINIARAAAAPYTSEKLHESCLTSCGGGELRKAPRLIPTPT